MSSERGGAVFVFGVQAIIDEVEAWIRLPNYKDYLSTWGIDDLSHSATQLRFLVTGAQTDFPLGRRTGINTEIDVRADYQIWTNVAGPTNYGFASVSPTNSSVYGDHYNHSPIFLGGQTRGMAVQTVGKKGVQVIDTSAAADDSRIFFTDAGVDQVYTTTHDGTASPTINGKITEFGKNLHEIILVNNEDHAVDITLDIAANDFLVYTGYYSDKPIGTTNYDYRDFSEHIDALNDGLPHGMSFTIGARQQIKVQFAAESDVVLPPIVAIRAGYSALG